MAGNQLAILQFSHAAINSAYPHHIRGANKKLTAPHCGADKAFFNSGSEEKLSNDDQIVL